MDMILVPTVLSLFISPSFGEVCNLTNLFNDTNDQSSYFSLDQNTSCYVIALRKEPFKSAKNLCRQIGGQLTDVESSKNNNLQTYLNTEIRNFTTTEDQFWIGLMWNYFLSEWYWQWQNGAEISPILKGRKYENNPCTIDYLPWKCSACVYMTKNNINQCTCDKKKYFICKLDLTYYKFNNDDNITCTPRCKAYIKEHISEPSNVNQPDNSDTDNNTTKVNETQPVEGQQNSFRCAIHFDDKNASLLHVMLGCVVAIQALVIIILGVTNFRFRRLLNKEENPHTISLVDTLSVDNTETSKARPQESSRTRLAASEVLYTSVESPYSSPTKEDNQAPPIFDANYTNPTSVYETDDSLESFPALAANSGQKSTSEKDLERNYSHINRSREKMDNAEPENIYGMESASQPIDLPSRKSPIYESYM